MPDQGNPELLDAANRRTGAALGLLAAALFGASAPISKLLLPGSGPLAIAGLLYLGAGIGLSILRVARRSGRQNREAPLRRADAPLLAGITIFGGVIGPVLMLVGLQTLPGMTSALLLNLEAPFTMLLAIVLFREHLGRMELGSATLILAGGAVLGFRPDSLDGDGLGIVAIVGACLCWAIDNNLTQKLSTRDPVAVVRFKALLAGGFSLALAGMTKQPFGRPAQIAGALALGSVSYGLSIVLHLYALRILGAARQAAFFATAPFAGALLAIPVLGERPSGADLVGALGMALGVIGLARARHSHLHTHEPIEHDHLHVHDEHHQHEHEGPITEPHSHPHRHGPLIHEHPHVSDVHHRHPHE